MAAIGRAWPMTADMRSLYRTGLYLKFPVIREINREFFKFGPFSAILAPNRPANSIACSKIPYAMEQGIIFVEREFSRPNREIGPRKMGWRARGAPGSGRGGISAHAQNSGGPKALRAGIEKYHRRARAIASVLRN